MLLNHERIESPQLYGLGNVYKRKDPYETLEAQHTVSFAFSESIIKLDKGENIIVMF